MVQEITLIKVDANQNNNKFYRVRLDGNSITKTWGRVGHRGQSSVVAGSDAIFGKIVKDKSKRGYKVVDVDSSTTAVSASGNKNSALLKEVATRNLSGNATGPIQSAIAYMVECNRHNILETSGGMIKVDTSGIAKTPLGIVSKKNLTDAEKILDSVGSASGVKLMELTEDYLTLIPQVVHGRDWAKNFFDGAAAITAQRTLLRQLRSSADWHESQVTTSTTDKSELDAYNDLFNCSMSLVTDTDTIKKISEKYSKSANASHSASRLKIKNIYELSYSDKFVSKFDKVAKAVGNVKQLWHGTDTGNVLSILREGLFCPPVNNADFKISGRMFGNGVYLSDQSTKALNYSYGYWGNARSPRCFMFLADVAMGNEYWPNRDGGRFDSAKAYSGTCNNGKKFNSISVKGGTCGVMNNEQIVWNTEQIMLRYLIEFEN